jgi:hypothetical protein
MILAAINKYISSDSIFPRSNQKAFYKIIVQQAEYQDVTVKITRITPSSWLIHKFPPSFVFERESNVFLFYTGMEVLFKANNDFIKSILGHYKKYLNNDLLSDGSFNTNYTIGDYKTWEISLIEGSLNIIKNVPDPFRPRLIPKLE